MPGIATVTVRAKAYTIREDYFHLARRRQQKEILTELTPEEAGAILDELVGRATKADLEWIAQSIAHTLLSKSTTPEAEFGHALMALKSQQQKFIREHPGMHAGKRERSAPKKN